MVNSLRVRITERLFLVVDSGLSGNVVLCNIPEQVLYIVNRCKVIVVCIPYGGLGCYFPIVYIVHCFH